jgi:putative ABC transport system permease protein
MEILPILSAMRRNKVGAVLIAVQMAITLAILCNGLFIIEQRVTASRRPTGLDEANVFTVTNQWVGTPTDLPARLRADLDAIRSVPNVIDVTVTNAYPLSDGGSSNGVKLTQDQKESTARTAVYLGDEHALAALGLRLIAGRNFNAEEVTDRLGWTDLKAPTSVIITQGLARAIYPNGDALGKTIYNEFQKGGVPIIGIVERLQVPWVSGGTWAAEFNDNSMILPFRYAAGYSHYMVRARDGQINGVMKAVEKKLYEVNPNRALERVEPQAATRVEAYKDDRGLAIILGVVCAALILVTAFGIVGLTSYWVAQRRKQIGIRRALGASRNHIVRYFQTENLLIAGVGASVGVALAVAVNLWMVSAFAMQRLHTGYAVVGAVVILLLGQAAVLFPALRAASIPPAMATRSGL